MIAPEKAPGHTDADTGKVARDTRNRANTGQPACVACDRPGGSVLP